MYLMKSPSREADVKSSARGDWRAVITRSLKDPTRRKYIVACFGKIMKYEIRQLCSDNHSSILRSGHVDDITGFRWSKVIEEAETYMPVFLQVLNSCLDTPSKRDNTTASLG